MTTPHPIGELLRTGVRPTDEETEHLTALGGFVAEMYGRYLEGHSPDFLKSGSDAWSKRLSGRLAASTGERWQAGLGLTDLLLDSGFSNWWQISQDGFANGYGEFDAEREVLALFEEGPQIVAATDEAPAPRRRRSLFGQKNAQPGEKRRAPKPRAGQPGAVARTAERVAGPEAASKPRAGRWADGAIAELTVLKALAAGGLHIADQVSEVLDGAPELGREGVVPSVARPEGESPIRWQARAPRAMATAARAALMQAGTSAALTAPGRSAIGGRAIALDGMRVDERTPALATALERARAVFGASVAGPGPALNASRLEAMTSAVKVSIDRGLGEGERPVYGFYDAVESTFLSLAKETSPEAAAGADAPTRGATPRAGRTRAARAAQPTGSNGPRIGTQGLAPARFEGRRADAHRGAAPMQHVSLDRVVPASARDLRPFTGGVFATPGQAPEAMDFATRIAFSPTAQPVAGVQRGAISAPRMAVTTLVPQARGFAQPGAAFTAAASGVAGPTGVSAAYVGASAQTSRFELARTAGMGSAAGSGAPQSSWRLAADGGADLPIGAGFGRAEVFGATREINSRAEMRTIGDAFRPVIARSGEDAVARPNRLADAVDGLVWVSTPEHAADVSPLTQVGDISMSAVPSGRRTSMVPAGAAFAAIARAAAGQTRRGAVAARADGAADVAPMRSTANIIEMLRAGVLAREGAGARSAELTAFGGANVTGAQARITATESLAAAVGSAPVADSATIAVQQGIASSQPLAAPTQMLQPRWLDAVLADSSTSPALRASRWLEDVIAQGGYGRVDDLRVMLAMANDTATPVPAEAGAETSTPSARAFNRMTRLQARTTAAAPARGQAAGRAGATVEAERGELQVAREARQALLRPVMTARESRAAAGVLGAQGMSALAGQSVSTGFGATALRLAVEAARSNVTSAARAQVAGAASSNEPVLSRLVSSAHAERSAAPGISARWDADGGLVERVARLGSSERARVVQMLSSAGWTSGELQLLDLARPGAVAQAEALPAVAGPVGSMPARTFAAARGETARGSEAAPEAARVGRMGQSIARVMSGAEALGGNVAESVSGSQAQAMARAQASAWLPLLGTGAMDKYFGGLAPSTTGASRMAYASVGDAVGELVKMAEAAAAQSDTVVATEAQRETLRRVLAVHGSVAEAARVAQASTPRGAAMAMAQAERMQARAATVAGDVRPEGGAQVALSAQAPQIGQLSAIGERAILRALATAAGADRATVREAAISAGIDQTLVERAMQRAGLDVATAAGGERIGLGMTERAMEIAQAERTMVGLASERSAPADGQTAEAVGATGRTSSGGLEQRLARALALSTAGPAGARRLTRALLGAKPAKVEERAPVRTRRDAQARAEQGAAAAEPVRRTALTAASFRNLGLEAAAVGEETRHALPIGLSDAIAPEVMLAGLRSPELARAVKAISQHQSVGGWDAVGVFTTLSDAGIDLGAARTSLAAEGRGLEAARSLFSRGEIGTLLQNRGADAPTGGDVATQLAELGHMSPRVAAMVRDAARSGGATQRALLEVLSGGDAATAIARAGLGKRQRAGLLSAVLRGTERAERSSLLEAAGGSDFAFAWLARVDGTKSGLDIGLGEARAELGRTFGKRRDSTLAESSPMGGASLVSTASATGGEGGNGLRSVGAHGGGAAGASGGRAQHGASDAMRRTDWRFVETGSRASTAHADLGKLAAAIVGNSESGKRAPMPLVAPAAKAIAQTALRKPVGESTSKGGGGGGGGGKKAGGSEPKLSEKAIEALAVEMANRVARLMGLMKERIGVW